MKRRRPESGWWGRPEKPLEVRTPLRASSLNPDFVMGGVYLASSRQWTFVGKVMSLLFNMLSRLVIAFLPRSKCLLVSWLQSPSAVILEAPKIKSLTVSIVSPSTLHEVMGLDTMSLVFWMLSFKPAFSLSSFSFIKRLLSSAYLRLLIFLPAILIPTWHFAWCTLHIN